MLFIPLPLLQSFTFTERGNNKSKKINVCSFAELYVLRAGFVGRER